MHIFSPALPLLRMKITSFATLALALSLAACSSNPEKDKDREPRDPDRPSVFNDRSDPLAQKREDRRLAQLDAGQLYKRARRNLDSSDFAGAIESYDILSTRHPFSDYTTQGELERIYALYRNFDPERALSGADRFLREHPRHPAVDYVHYLKGLINFSRDESPMNILPVDDSKSDVTSQRRAFDDFALLLQKYPGSQYASDAYARMVFIRNRLAAHEMHVVDFYVRRGAYVAAAKRAEQIIAQYPGTPASYRALAALVECYQLAGLTQQAQDAQALLAGQDPAAVSRVPDPQAVSAAGADAPPPPEKPGLMSRIAGIFSPLDSSEGGVELVIPSGDTADAAAADPADVAGSQTSTAQAPDAAAAEPAPETRRSNKLEIFYESPEGESTEAAPAGGSVEPAADASAP